MAGNVAAWSDSTNPDRLCPYAIRPRERAVSAGGALESAVSGGGRGRVWWLAREERWKQQMQGGVTCASAARTEA
jgi:hypothetical protein